MTLATRRTTPSQSVPAPRIFVDGDACPVKDEIYRVAERHDLKVFVVSQGSLRVPIWGRIEHVRVGQGVDAADDWIVERAGARDIVVTADIPLAGRCLKNRAQALAPNGTPFTEDSIGEALASRELMDQLRQMGMASGGPAPFTPADRSRFQARLGQAIDRLRRVAVMSTPR